MAADALRQTDRHTIEEEAISYTDELRHDLIEAYKRAGYKDGMKLSRRLRHMGRMRTAWVLSRSR